MAGDIFTLDAENNAAVRTVSVNAGASENNSPVIFTTDADGNAAVRVVGSGGGDSHNQGYYATPEALREAVPTAEAGDWAIVGSTDTVWVWDEEGSAWVDTDTKGEVTPDMIIVKSLTMPSASTTPAGAVYQYIGQTNANYTHGYIYENVKTATYTGTVSFEAASLSGTTVVCSGDDFANFLTESGVSPLSVVSGTMTYDAAGSLWVLVGKNASDETVLSFQEYQQDFEDAGFVFTGTPQDGDVITFTCTVEEASASYAWNRIDVQPAPVIPDPLPDQTGNAGKFLTTDGTDASWGTQIAAQRTDNTFFYEYRALDVKLAALSASINVTYDIITYSMLHEGEHPLNKYPLLRWVDGDKTLRISTLEAGSSQTYYFAPTYFAPYRRFVREQNLGTSENYWDKAFVKYLNNGADIAIPTTGGTLALTSDLPSSPATMPELTVAGWSNNTQTVTVTGVTATNTVFVSPAPASAADYAAAGIICTAQAADSLTFTCTTVPTNAITVNVVIF